mgnify:CR=1 FL=1
MPKKVLITGVCGLIGSHLSRYLLEKDYKVYGIDDLSGGYEDNLPFGERFRFYCGSVTDKKWFDAIFESITPDYVYHFAAYAAEGLSPFIRNFNYTNNLIGSVNVINNCVKFNSKIIFTSSMAVYGKGTPPFHEDDMPNPVDPYGIAKYAVEMDIKQAHDQFGLRYSIVRPHNIIGIYQNIWDKYRNVIGIWIRLVLKGEPITIFGDGTQKRAFSDVKFYMEPLEKLMEQGDGEIFNLGADKEYPIKEVAHVLGFLGAESGFSSTTKYLEKRHEVKDAFCSHAKAKALLDFKDETNLQETIREMFEWAKTQPDREVKVMDYEIDKNMYDYWK